MRLPWSAYRLSRLLVPLLVLAVLSPRVPAADLAVDDDEGMGRVVALVPGFQPERGTGVLLALSAEGTGEAVQEHFGENVQHAWEVTSGATTWVVVLWRSLEHRGEYLPEVWSLDDYPRLIWGGIPRIRWLDARVSIVEVPEGWAFRVDRALTGENSKAPVLRCQEDFLLTGDGIRLRSRDLAEPANPDQQLNLIADLAAREEWKAMIEAVKKLPPEPESLSHRAGLVLTRYFPPSKNEQPVEELLRYLVGFSDSPEIVTEAGNRLLERAWRRAKDPSLRPDPILETESKAPQVSP